MPSLHTTRDISHSRHVILVLISISICSGDVPLPDEGHDHRAAGEHPRQQVPAVVSGRQPAQQVQ